MLETYLSNHSGLSGHTASASPSGPSNQFVLKNAEYRFKGMYMNPIPLPSLPDFRRYGGPGSSQDCPFHS